MMHTYKVFFKDGTSTYANCHWTGLTTIESLLDDSKQFIRIGNNVFAKDFIAHIQKIETTEE